MKTINELKRIANRVGKILWTAWLGADVFFLVFFIAGMIVLEPILFNLVTIGIFITIFYFIGRIMEDFLP